MSKIHFRHEGQEENLGTLLTIQDWTPKTVSRIVFYNTRTAKSDRQSGKPKIVVADGDYSFLTALDEEEFYTSDVVGVIQRTIERDRLEAIGAKLESLRQWYNPDRLALPEHGACPRGIGYSILRKSQP